MLCGEISVNIESVQESVWSIEHFEFSVVPAEDAAISYHICMPCENYRV